MRRWVVVFVVAAAAFGAASLSPARTPGVGTPNAYANHCYKGYVHADLSWGKRCLRAGQRCKKVNNPEYHQYKFQCVNGRLMKLPTKK
jgi:hypothetical protein